MPISAFVICQDEEHRIAPCLESLAACREIIVVDSGSTDGTLKVVEALRESGLPIILLHQPWLGFAAQKQFALEQASQPWCLSLDADERLDPGLAAALPALIAAPPEVAGWRLKRLPSTLEGYGPTPRFIYAKPILRLVRRDRAHFDARVLVHEGIIVEGGVRDAPRGLIWHDQQLTFQEQFRKQLVYAELKARERIARGRRASLLALVVTPLFYFLRFYFKHRWFLCGRAGFIQAVTAAVYSFSVEAEHFIRQQEADLTGSRVRPTDDPGPEASPQRWFPRGDDLRAESAGAVQPQSPTPPGSPPARG